MKTTRKPERITGIRKLDRAVAKANMKKRGLTRINRGFAAQWREYV
jgi:hypothetical protein